MLLQQGLTDIARSSPSEQVAYLLVERARLLDELEAEQGRSVEREHGNNALKQRLEELQQELEEEKEDSEEDLAEEREKTRKMEESMKAAHKKEMAAIVVENEKLQETLNTATSKVGQWISGSIFFWVLSSSLCKFYSYVFLFLLEPEVLYSAMALNTTAGYKKFLCSC